MDKPAKSQPQALSTLVHKTLNTVFAKRGFASTELLARWPEIVGADISACCQPEKIQWPRPGPAERPEPGTLMLRVEGPQALEIQHLSKVILERVNRFFGWQAIAALRLRQAPLAKKTRTAPRPVDQEAAAQIAATLSAVRDEKLRNALARLGAVVKQT